MYTSRFDPLGIFFLGIAGFELTVTGITPSGELSWTAKRSYTFFGNDRSASTKGSFNILEPLIASRPGGTLFRYGTGYHAQHDIENAEGL